MTFAGFRPRLLLAASMAMGVSCAAQKIPTAPKGGTGLGPGDVALVGFSTSGNQSDYFAFALLKAVVKGSFLSLTDENWTGSALGLSDGAIITWSADKDYPAGTVVETLPTSDGSKSSTYSYAVKILSGGATYTNVTGPGNQAGTYAVDASSPIQVITVANTGGGLTGWSSGDQFLFFQGPAVLGEGASGITFLGAVTYNTDWLTGTPNASLATGAGCYLPPGLTDHVNAMAITLTVGKGGYYNCANGTTGTAAALAALFYDQSKWTLNMSTGDLPDPVLTCAITVQ